MRGFHAWWKSLRRIKRCMRFSTVFTSRDGVLQDLATTAAGNVPESCKRRNPIFGVPIEVLMTKPCNVKARVPVAFELFMTALHADEACFQSEGLFRIPAGNNRLRAVQEILQRDSASFRAFDLTNEYRDIKGDLLKRFLREIPGRLLIDSLADEWNALAIRLANEGVIVGKVPDAKKMLKMKMDGKGGAVEVTEVAELLQKLPCVHREMMKDLCLFLRKLCDHETTTKMSVESIGTVMAPNLLTSASPFTYLGCLLAVMLHNFSVCFQPKEEKEEEESQQEEEEEEEEKEGKEERHEKGEIEEQEEKGEKELSPWGRVKEIIMQKHEANSTPVGFGADVLEELRVQNFSVFKELLILAVDTLEAQEHKYTSPKLTNRANSQKHF
eukprot:TRINITY_DN3850_c0_g1_i1.p1 TRINITY_DN3850_c0_g1~~TRINITY_DN3850_c0_g1_i1.p1  ORF type:complete len:385 (+),score=81.40 TRINITY_DN3850_c0_g1_i1:1086-2240(+)